MDVSTRYRFIINKYKVLFESKIVKFNPRGKRKKISQNPPT